MEDSELEADKFLAPLEESHAFSTFVGIVFRGWGKKVSGVTWAIFTFVIGYAFGPYASIVAAVIAGIWIYVVCYQAWRSERQRSDRLYLQLTASRAALSDPNNFQLRERLKAADTALEYYKKRLTPVLHVDPNSVACYQIQYPYKSQLRWCKVARFEIENTGEVTVYGVQATIRDLRMNGDPNYKTVPLQPSDEFNHQGKGKFSLAPQERKFIDIAKRLDDNPGHSDGTFLRLAAPDYISRTIADDEIHGLKITVTADDHASLSLRVDLTLRRTPFTGSKGSGIHKSLDCTISRKANDDPTEIISLA